MADERHPERRHTVVCVDDEAPILAALNRLLRREPYELVTTDHPSEALDLVDKRDVSVVITDQRMPEMCGTELLGAVRRRSPETRRVILTGYADMNMLQRAVNDGGIGRLISKPWNDDELRSTIRDLVIERERGAEPARPAGLEDLLRRQTWSLRVVQEMLDGLDTPLAGIAPGAMRIIYCNQAFLRLCGATLAALRDSDVRGLLPAEVCERLREMAELCEESAGVQVHAGPFFRLRRVPLGQAAPGILLAVEGNVRRWPVTTPPAPREVRIDCRDMTAAEILGDLERVLRRLRGQPAPRIVIENLSRLADSMGRLLRGLLRLLAELETGTVVIEREGYARAMLAALGDAFPFVKAG